MGEVLSLLPFQVWDHLKDSLRSQKESDPSLRFVLGRTRGERRYMAGPGVLILHPTVNRHCCPFTGRIIHSLGQAPLPKREEKALSLQASGPKGKRKGRVDLSMPRCTSQILERVLLLWKYLPLLRCKYDEGWSVPLLQWPNVLLLLQSNNF